jgi:hypothetical protein
MYRRWMLTLMLCGLGACLFAANFSAASTALRVNEAATRVRLSDEQARVSLALENPAGRSFTAHIQLDLFDPQNHVRARAERRETIRPGAGAVVIPLPLRLAEATQAERSELLWYRLRYRVCPLTSDAAPVEGIISLSEITPDLFELRLIASEHPVAGRRYRAYARAAHPLTARPIAGVQVAAELSFDNEQKSASLKAAGVTDAGGYAALDFDLPRALDVHDGELKVTARHGDFAQEATADLQDDHLGWAQILVNTDKTLYQPGQTLHVRALAFDFAKRAIADAAVTLKVRDPEGTYIFRASLKTSRFGVASADWSIPESARLGEYFVELEMDDERYSNAAGGQLVKISRYELPNFTLSVKPDRAYYLPGQNAEVEVRADYLFGQPVARGRVRVVRETEREWNYREQKWETKEAEKDEGETDAAGRFTARIDLAAAHRDFADENYRRFRDLPYAAYFTDPTTNRTEQRRFDLRVTGDAIHLYVIEEGNQQADNFPLQFYLSTSYADGTPAPCEVAISEVVSDATKPGGLNERADDEEPLRKIQTNRYGVAKVSGLMLRQREERGQRVSLSFLARDGRGAGGRHAANLWWYGDRPVIRVETGKTLHRAGEPIEVQLTASQPNLTVLLTAMREMQIIHSQVVSLRRGRAFLVLPYREEFKDEVQITAQTDAARNRGCCEDYHYGSRTVLYPRDRELKLSVRLDQAEYRPGAEARADFRVQSPDGRAVESALGVTVIDRAVEERTRTDQEFGRRPARHDYLRSYLGADDELAGISRRDLRKLDLAQPLPDGLELVAEILLRGGWYVPRVFGGDDYAMDQAGVFGPLIAGQLQPLKDALGARYQRQGEYPADEAALHRLLAEAGINFGEWRDPWGVPYRAAFFTEREFDVCELLCAGADKRFGTADDFSAARLQWPYFNAHSAAIWRALEQYQARSTAMTLDAARFQQELQREGFDLAALRDRWGRAYDLQLSVSGARLLVNIRSGGPNGRLEPSGGWPSDDFTVWNAAIEYFAPARARIDAALASHYQTTGSFPQNEAELREVLQAAGLAFDAWRDPWGRGYYATFKPQLRYSDRVVISYREYESAARQRTEIRPVTQRVNFIVLRSRGEDGAEGTRDDFDVAEFLRITAEAASQDPRPQPPSASTVLSGATGAISGTITDPQGAVVPGATVKATHKTAVRVFETKSDGHGRFLLRDLPAGLYEVICHALGFKSTIFVDIPVRSSSLVEINVMLEIGATSEAVTVTAGAVDSVQTSSATITSHSLVSLPLNGRNPAGLARLQPGAVQIITRSGISTPRLREYFPETLVWQPQLETDRQGRAQLKFKLADNITTWKLAVVGSTLDGEIGVAEKEIRAFQPFFAELDPPRILTEGDEIALPVVLRNYLNKAQTVETEIKPEEWFTLLGPARTRTEIAAGEAARTTFELRAIASVKDGKQRVTAHGSEASDAIEKPVSVHPDGEEVTQTASQVFNHAAALDITVPDATIQGTARAELKIYPNLMAHALEGIEGILRRPYGCAEQTISSTYPNVMALRYLKQLGEGPPALAAKARLYTQAGYERLLGYRAANSGFTYWGRGEADLALTAYALKFLTDAQEFIAVDAEVITGARAWLIRQQRDDGSWPAYQWQSQDPRRILSLTSFIARVLAAADSGAARASQTPKAAGDDPALARAFHYLARHTEELDEPYAIASYALAALAAGEPERAAPALERLRALAHTEAGTNYWALESNTPFYGWGLAGRIETTALAVRALALAAEHATSAERKTLSAREREASRKDAAASSASAAQNDELVRRGLLFLLRHKDRYGVWLSTQATINVLDTLIALNDATGAQASAGGAAEVTVNGRRAASVTLPPSDQLSQPLTVDLSAFLTPGRHRIEVKRALGSAAATAQVVASYYVPWAQSSATSTENFRSGAASALRLAVKFDAREAKVGAEVTCRVEAERVGFRGYGMLLAEIGLPPGAEVDRASLERAMQESGEDINQYDVLPDRLIVYLWPRAGGTRFAFTFRPRFGIKAQTAPSVLYDYYNPEASLTVAPVKFLVRE